MPKRTQTSSTPHDAVKTNFDFEQFSKEASGRLLQGESLSSVMAPLLKQIIEKALEGELDAHLAAERSATFEGLDKPSQNRRNGLLPKDVKTSHGQLEIKTSRDRNGTFEPKLIPKWSRELGTDLEKKLLSLYGLGMSYNDIRKHVQELYGLEISESYLSQVTDKILPAIVEWQNRPLSEMYVLVYLDAMYVQVRENGKVQQKAIFNVIGVDIHGKKDVLGFYFAETESAKVWRDVLQDLQRRGVKDILIVSVDGLTGFKAAIQDVFPKALVQRCIVHCIRYALRLVASKDTSEFLKDLKAIYQANTLAEAEYALQYFADKWGKKYAQSVGTWVNNWHEIATLFEFKPPLRKLMYTTNSIEAYHRQQRRILKTKSAFVNEEALKKLLFLNMQNITQTWNKNTTQWKAILNELVDYFGDRVEKYINSF
jgi:transposase-like protein